MLPSFRRSLQRPAQQLFRAAAEGRPPPSILLPSAVSPSSTVSASPLWARSRKVAAPDKYTVGALVAESFKRDPQKTAVDIARSLGTLDKGLLISALSGASAGSEGEVANPNAHNDPSQLAHELFESSDTQYPKGFLSKDEFIQALSTHKQILQEPPVQQPQLVNWRLLSALVVASAVPYIGFGFLDNFIMIVAGERIECAFGVALGLSTMAAAGLGNLVSDIAGLGFAEQIEQQARRFNLASSPQLSRVQEALFAVRVAKGAGQTIGVSIGCLLGMVPLLWMNYGRSKDEPDS